MRYINDTEYNALLKDAKFYTGEIACPATLLTANGQIVKFLRKPKRLLSRLCCTSYAKRIQNNATKLNKLGITSIHITDAFYSPQQKCTAITYPFINAPLLKQVITPQHKKLLENFIAFVNALHNKGIICSDLHLGNILYLGHNNFALIDLQSVKISNRPLSLRKRTKNLNKLIYKIQRCQPEILNSFGIENFIAYYAKILT
jgi:hypothetical protein